MSDKMTTSQPKELSEFLENENKLASPSPNEELESLEYDTEDDFESNSEEDDDPWEVVATIPRPEIPQPVRRAVRLDHHNVCSRRIMQELKNIALENGSFEGRNYCIKFSDNNIREWSVHITKLFRKCPLKDEMTGPNPTIQRIWFKVYFPDHYPNYPPSVGLIEPSISNKYINLWGRNCLKILQPEHWQPEYTMELVIMHLTQVLQLRSTQIRPFGKTHHELFEKAHYTKARGPAGE